MKLSILIPSLYKILFERMLASIRQNPMPEGWTLEVVLVSPYEYAGEEIVQVLETNPSGTNPAMRKAFKASSGDVIGCVADDMTVTKDCFVRCLATMGDQKDTIASMEGGMFHCFDRRYAICPMALRETVEKYWDFFYPYISHWGDPAFSLHMWRSGGKVIPVPGGTVAWGLDRLGCGEATHKKSSFDEDYARFLKDFAEMTPGYNLKDVLSFNNAN